MRASKPIFIHPVLVPLHSFQYYSPPSHPHQIYKGLDVRFALHVCGSPATILHAPFIASCIVHDPSSTFLCTVPSTLAKEYTINSWLT